MAVPAAEGDDVGPSGRARRSRGNVNYALDVPMGEESDENAEAYGDEDADGDGDEDADGDLEARSEDHEVMPRSQATRSGRLSRNSHGIADEDDFAEASAITRTTRSGRSTTNMNYHEIEDDDEDEDDAPRPRRRPTAAAVNRDLDDFVVDDEGESSKRSSARRFNRKSKMAALASKRRGAKSARQRQGSSYSEGDEKSSDDDDEDLSDLGSEDQQIDSQTPGYSLRQRTTRPNYSLVPPPLDTGVDGPDSVPTRGRPKKFVGNSPYELNGMQRLSTVPGLTGVPKRKSKDNWNNLPVTMSGKDYEKFFGAPDQDSSDEDIPNSRKAGNNPAMFGGSAAGGLLGAGGIGTAGGGAGADLGANRDAHGRMKGANELADIDPLGVNMQVDFNAVGGLDEHIQQLKEMVSLPLLYPEVFQRFNVTPPRGVLFHGPPGTGKTLVARALAASCSSSGQQISFFMRKGADCLSKWVGEAERQLRLLFEEARNAQPSIIFFDEIDGLAPVRSSKQDQIHASIVSTLLALMDGMDGRGQVVVIGATNRPDSVDPALRRPGRFDREFYFALPSREARRSIINIHTKGWHPPLADDFKDRLAEVTKGYGGADLRALCTEAALNAIQRRYPQIYSTTERLQLAPETIKVDAKDFMMSVNKVVPSSARSSSSSASPLPEHLKPLLSTTVDEAIEALKKVMPPTMKRNPLEEAMWEDDQEGSADGGFGREMLLQSFEKLRVHRPRLLIHGQSGMGQAHAGTALLHHLEGYHVQVLDIASIMGDSSMTPEAAIVQRFNEARRHKPSILFIPELVSWANSVTESIRTTTKSLLDGISSSDPILLLAVAEEPSSALPHDVRPWFGYLRHNKIEVTLPSSHKRQNFFAEVLVNVKKPPNEFPDALPRRKRVLEDLPKAPPPPPRQPTAAELQQQAADDSRLLEHLKFRLGPILAELRKKFPRFKRDIWVEYNLQELTQQFQWRREKGKIIVTLLYEPDSQLLQRRRRSSADPERLGSHLGPTSGNTNANRGASAEATSLQIPPFVGPPGSQESIGAGFPSSDEALTQNAYLQGGHASNNGLTGLAAAMAGGFSSSNPPPANPNDNGEAADMRKDESGFYVRDLKIWTVTLEKMQKRLYYNGYLTCADFLEDLERIVSNAEEAQEVDEERLTRAHQLRNLAVVLLDQYIDSSFRDECERMAARTLKREAETKEAEEKVKAQAQAQPNGAAVKEDLAGAEKKRTRSISGQLNGVNGIEEEKESRKKVKMGSLPTNMASSGDISMGLAPEQAALLGQGGVRMTSSSMASGAPETQAQVQFGGSVTGSPAWPPMGGQQPPLPHPQHQQYPQDSASPYNQSYPPPREHTSQQAWPSAYPGQTNSTYYPPQQQQPFHPQGYPGPGGIANGSATAAPPAVIEQAYMTGIPSPLVRQPVTSNANEEQQQKQSVVQPAPSLPKFVVDWGRVEELGREMLKLSEGFNVEQLEQLRAACFDVIWKRRAEWKREEMIKELMLLVRELHEAVEEERKDVEKMKREDEYL